MSCREVNRFERAMDRIVCRITAGICMNKSEVSRTVSFSIRLLIAPPNSNGLSQHVVQYGLRLATIETPQLLQSKIIVGRIDNSQLVCMKRAMQNNLQVTGYTSAHT